MGLDFAALRGWSPWLRVAGLRVLFHLPSELRLLMGSWWGAYRYRRDHVGRARLERQLGLCLRRASTEQRERIVKRHFEQRAQFRLDRGLLWWGGSEEWRRRVSIEGEDHLRPLLEANRPVILFTFPHVAQEIAAVAFHRRYFMALSTADAGEDRLEERLALRARRSSGGVVLAAGNQMQLVRMVREGFLLIHPVETGERAIPVEAAPFFGATALLSLSLPRLARLCQAVAVPYMVYYREGRYVVRLFPALRFGPRPGNASRLAAAWERMAAAAPEQVLWSELVLQAPERATVTRAATPLRVVPAPRRPPRPRSGPWRHDAGLPPT